MQNCLPVSIQLHKQQRHYMWMLLHCPAHDVKEKVQVTVHSWEIMETRPRRGRVFIISQEWTDTRIFSDLKYTNTVNLIFWKDAVNVKIEIKCFFFKKVSPDVPLINRRLKIWTWLSEKIMLFSWNQWTNTITLHYFNNGM